MNLSIVRYLTAAWIGVAFGSLDRAALASDSEANLRITVYVYNWAQVEPKALRTAKEVATHIFRKAGVEAVLLDLPLPSGNEQTSGMDRPFLPRPHFLVNIIPQATATRMGLRTMTLGVAPGTPDERGRNQVYVFDHVAERMIQKVVMARLNGAVFPNAAKGQILGHGMAHEIGHVLLLQDSHAPAGLMRANWERNDLQNMVAGDLLFTPEQAERIRTEIVRRTGEK